MRLSSNIKLNRPILQTKLKTQQQKLNVQSFRAQVKKTPSLRTFPPLKQKSIKRKQIEEVVAECCDKNVYMKTKAKKLSEKLLK